MKAPDKIYVPARFRLVDGLRVRESDTDEEYIRKDALLEWLKEQRNEHSFEVWKAYQRTIEKIESL